MDMVRRNSDYTGNLLENWRRTLECFNQYMVNGDWHSGTRYTFLANGEFSGTEKHLQHRPDGYLWCASSVCICRHASVNDTFYYYHQVESAFHIIREKDTVSQHVIPEVYDYEEKERKR